MSIQLKKLAIFSILTVIAGYFLSCKDVSPNLDELSTATKITVHITSVSEEGHVISPATMSISSDSLEADRLCKFLREQRYRYSYKQFFRTLSNSSTVTVHGEQDIVDIVFWRDNELLRNILILGEEEVLIDDCLYVLV